MLRRILAGLLSAVLVIGGVAMAFPLDPLRVRTELFIDGEYVDVTSDVRGEATINISRGRKNEQGRVSPTTCSVTFNDRTGKYNNRNPLSPYYGKIGRNVLMRQSVVWAEDDFEGRTVSAGLGTSEDGHTYTTSGGAAGDYDVTGGKQTIEITSVNVGRLWHVASFSVKQPMARVTFKPGEVATGASIQMSLLLHVVDTSNYLQAVLDFATDGTVGVIAAQRVAGVATSLSFNLGDIPYDANTEVTLEAYVDGNTFSLRAWDAADPTVTSSTQGTITEEDLTNITGSVGVRVIASTGNTNGTFTAEVDDFLVTSPRCVVEVPEKSRHRDISGTDLYVKFEGSGVLRRLGQGTTPRLSSFRRHILSQEWTSLLAYWPGEDESNSTSVAAGISTVEPMSVQQTQDDDVVFAGSDDAFNLNFRAQGFGSAIPPGTDPLMNLAGGGRVIGRVPPGTASPTQWTVAFVGRSDAPTHGSDIALLSWTTTDGTYARYEVVHDSSGVINFIAYDSVGSATTLLTGTEDESFLTEYRVEANQDGADVEYRLYVNGVSADSGTDTTSTLGRVHTIQGNPNRVTVAGTAGLYLGHIQVWDEVWDTDLSPTLGNSDKGAAAQYTDDGNSIYYPWYGYLNETLADRLARLCAENGISFELVGDAEDTPRMGPQETNDLLSLLYDSAKVDSGLLYESRYTFGLVYRTKSSLYNQSGLELDQSLNHLSADPKPVEDDQSITNRFMASRADGSSFTASLETGPMSTLPPVQGGVGEYAREDVFNVSLDSTLADLAQWEVHIGTHDEDRFTGIEVNMARDAFVDDPSLVQDVINTELGDHIKILNPPSDLAPEDIEQFAQGYREVISNDASSRGWVFTFNTTPAKPYSVVTLDDDDYSYLGSDGSTVDAAFDAGTDTSMDVDIAAGYPLWTDEDAPFDIMVSGVRLTVTAIAGASSPQTFTITQTPVNGIEKTIPVGSPVDVYAKSYIGM